MAGRQALAAARRRRKMSEGHLYVAMDEGKERGTTGFGLAICSSACGAGAGGQGWSSSFSDSPRLWHPSQREDKNER
jgi:hypothetical protein